LLILEANWLKLRTLCVFKDYNMYKQCIIQGLKKIIHKLSKILISVKWKIISNRNIVIIFHQL